MTKLPQEKSSQILDLWSKEGLSILQISAKLSISPETARKRVRGIPGLADQRSREHKEQRLKKMKRLWIEDGLSFKEIAKHLDVSDQTVGIYLRNIPSPVRQRQQQLALQWVQDSWRLRNEGISDRQIAKLKGVPIYTFRRRMGCRGSVERSIEFRDRNIPRVREAKQQGVINKVLAIEIGTCEATISAWIRWDQKTNQTIYPPRIPARGGGRRR
jgi:DNA-binding CsgD family transcriptional regulator